MRFPPLVLAIALLVPLAAMPLSSLAAEAQAPADTPTLGFARYEAPDDFPHAHLAGETSIGVDRATGATMFLMRTSTARVTFDAFGGVDWEAAGATLTSIETLDPILWLDPDTGRTFVAQLAGGASLFAFSDDDGASWTTLTLPVSAPSADHQTLGGGPFPPGVESPNGYPNAVYYCAQGDVVVQCTRSDDGGLTWGAPVPFPSGACSAIHGHVVVTPTGAALIPFRWCVDRIGVAASRDGGITWSVDPVPGTSTMNSDPALAVDAGGRVYLLASQGTHAVALTSGDDARTWSAPFDVGAALGMENAELHMAVGGDAGRAAVAFYGSTTPGDSQAGCACEITDVRPPFQGYWSIVVAMTLDGGSSWTAVDATPGDPAQHGCIWLGGGANRCRNLLDFQGIAVDAQGRVLVGFSDGCTQMACLRMEPAAYGEAQDDEGDSHGVILRQTSGPRLFAAYDPGGVPQPLLASAGGPYTTSVGVPATLAASAVGGVAPYSFAWDFDADGAFDDATGASPSFVSASAGTFALSLRATDAAGSATLATSSVRVLSGGPGQGEPVTVARWTFDGDGGACSGEEGWTTQSSMSGVDVTPALRWHVAHENVVPVAIVIGEIPEPSGSCIWTFGDDAESYQPYLLDTVLSSPDGAGCVEVPAQAVWARVRLDIRGYGLDSMPLRLRARACDGAWSLPLASFTESFPQWTTVEIGAPLLTGAGAFRLELAQSTTNALGWNGYKLDTFEVEATLPS